MDWVESLDRHNGKLVARVAGVGRPKGLVELDAMHLPNLPGITSSRLRRVRIDSDFEAWSISSTKEYFAGFDFDLDAEEHHQVFAIMHDGVRYLIPALVLMKAMFRPFHQLAAFLFAPHGLELLSIPDLGSKEPSVHLMPGTLDTHSKRQASVREPLSWFWCFPTARKCWDSVYLWACKGKLAMDLPTGKIRLVVKGKKQAGTCYVTECSVIQVDIQERPHEFAQAHRRFIVFHEGASLGDTRRGKRSRPAPLSDSKLLMRNGIWFLSDEEWDAIKPIAAPNLSPYRKHDLRIVLDGIIEKIGSGTPWQKMTYKAGDWRNACWEYRKLRNGGEWERICLILAQTRAPVDRRARTTGPMAGELEFSHDRAGFRETMSSMPKNFPAANPG